MRREDAADYARAFVDDPDLGRLIGVQSDPTEAWVLEGLDRAREYRAEGRFLEVAVTDTSGEPFWGSVNMHHCEWRHRRTELGVWLVPAARGRGAARRALALMIDWAFRSLDLERMEMKTTGDNERLAATAASLGFTREGCLRRRDVERGERVDVVVFGLLSEEWRPATAGGG